MVAAVACFVIVIKYLFAFQSYQPYKKFFSCVLCLYGFLYYIGYGMEWIAIKWNKRVRLRMRAHHVEYI